MAGKDKENRAPLHRPDSVEDAFREKTTLFPRANEIPDAPSTERLPVDASPSSPPSTPPWALSSVKTEVAKTNFLPSQAELNIPTLTIIAGPYAGRCYPIGEDVTVIGRGRLADIRLDDAAVSRAHARINCTTNGFWIEELQSTNGLFVGGERTAGCELIPGTRVQLGPHVVLRFSLTDQTEDSLQKRLYETSTRDELTGAFNRRYLFERLEAEVAFARRHASELALLMFDLDRFKKINDAYGHPIGDVVLRAVAKEIERLIRDEDVFARYGGEEFALLARATPKTDAVKLGERVRTAIEGLQIPSDVGELAVTVSVGVGALSEIALGPSAIDLVQMVDDRLYQAKGAGRNRVCDRDDVPTTGP